MPTLKEVLRNLRQTGRFITFSNYDSSTNMPSICHDGTVHCAPLIEQSIVAVWTTHILIQSILIWTVIF